MATSKYLDQSIGEEIANSITHGIGAVFGIVAIIFLSTTAIKSGDTIKIVSFVIYGFSIFSLFISSTLSHALTNPTAKKVFQIFDYSAIYLLIAGTYTPVLAVMLKGETSFIVLAIIWGLAIGGVIFKIFLLGKYEALSMFIYLQMGWMAIFIFDQLNKVPSTFLILIIAGGIAYTLGTGFYLATKMKYHHFIWHIFVLVGCILHFLAIILFV